MIKVQGSWHESIANHIFWKSGFWQQRLPNLEFVMEFKIKYQETFKLLLADSERERERERERESPFREAKRWSSFAKRIHGATTHLLLEPRLIGPGQRLALPAWGQRLVSAVCQRPSPRNMAAHLLCTHASMGQLGVATRTRISITRWSGSKSKKSFSCSCSCSCSSNPWGRHHCCCCCCWMVTSNSFYLTCRWWCCLFLTTPNFQSSPLPRSRSGSLIIKTTEMILVGYQQQFLLSRSHQSLHLLLFCHLLVEENS